LFEFWNDKVKKETKNLYDFIDPIINNDVFTKKCGMEVDEDDEYHYVGTSGSVHQWLDNRLSCALTYTDFPPDPRVLRDETLVTGRDPVR
jgi:hypothetical protein